MERVQYQAGSAADTRRRALSCGFVTRLSTSFQTREHAWRQEVLMRERLLTLEICGRLLKTIERRRTEQSPNDFEGREHCRRSCGARSLGRGF